MLREYYQTNQIKSEFFFFKKNKTRSTIKFHQHRYLNKDDCIFAVFEDDLVFADAPFALAGVLVTVTDLAVVASPDVVTVVFVDLPAVILVNVDVDVLSYVDVVVFFDVTAVVIVEVDADVFVNLAVVGLPDVTAVVSRDVAVAALEGLYAFPSISLCFSTEVSTSTSLISLSFFFVVAVFWY